MAPARAGSVHLGTRACPARGGTWARPAAANQPTSRSLRAGRPYRAGDALLGARRGGPASYGRGAARARRLRRPAGRPHVHVRKRYETGVSAFLVK
eukprot:scaffold52379_cov60-Phaeocystis_antarctica.AAC.5